MISNITEYLKLTLSCCGNNTAFCDREKSITFTELDMRARILACHINKRLKGAIKQPVGVYLPKGVDSVIAFIAAAYSGNFYTPLDVSMPESRLNKIIGALSPAVIITAGEYKELFGSASFETVVLNEVMDGSIDNGLLDGIARSVIDTDILYVMFTSGSTGEPKGVIVSHRAVIDYTDWLSDTFGFDKNTVFGNQAPFYFDNSVLDIYSTIKNGCKTVIIPEEMFLSAKRLCSFVDQNGINAIFWVPSAMNLVANSGVLKSLPLKKLKKIIFAGEVMPVRQLNIWRKFIPDALYANLYGPTEIAVDCTYYIVDREFDESESLPIGIPCKNTDIILLNDNNELVSGDEIGEICVRGTCLAHGYYGAPEKTETAFVQNPLNDKYPEKIYRTGDLARYNKRGELLYIGRKDLQIKHMGYRIELGEIETAASALTEYCCAMYDNEKKQIVLIAAPEDIDKKELYARLKRVLPGYMLPGLILSRSSLPLNQNGKIDRQALLEIIKVKEEAN